RRAALAGWRAVRERPNTAIGLRLADSAPCGIVLVGEVGDSARISNADNSLGGVIAIACYAAHRVRHPLEPPLAIVGRWYRSTVWFGDLGDPTAAIVCHVEASSGWLGDTGDQPEKSRSR